MTVTRRLAAILAADCDEISETGLLVADSVEKVLALIAWA